MRALLLALLLVCTQQATATVAPASKQVLAYSKQNLPTTGVLRHQGRFIYVDVDDSYVHSLLPIIKKYGFGAPPYFGKPGLVGAHISVISPDELNKNGIARINEVGRRIKFKLKRAKVETPPNWKTVDQVYFIEVEAPALAKLRAKYGLPKKEFKFHITVGIKPKA